MENIHENTFLCFCVFLHLVPIFPPLHHSGKLSLPLQFGDSQKLRLVRILRSTVMVRVGGGWEALEEFLRKHDPCRGEDGPGWL